MIFVGIDNTAHKATKAYIGINNMSRKIKAIYVGMVNIARKIFPGKRTITRITDSQTPYLYNNDGRWDMGVAQIGDYTLFAGGHTSSSAGSDYVDIYDTSLTRTHNSNTDFYNGNGRGSMGVAQIGNYTLFAGGTRGSTGSGSYYVDIYDTSLTRTHNSNTDFYNGNGRGNMGVAQIGNYTLFAGGHTSSSKSSDYVDIYDTSLTRTHNYDTDLYNGNGRGSMGVAQIGNYTLFAGGTKGSTGSGQYYVDIYDTSLTRTHNYDTDLYNGNGRGNMGVAQIGNYTLFAGGRSGTNGQHYVDIYDTSLTRTHNYDTDFYNGNGRWDMGVAQIGDYTLFAGGHTSSSAGSYYVDIYDTSLTRTHNYDTDLYNGNGRGNMGVIQTDDNVVYIGGTRGSTGSGQYYVDIYDTSLTRTYDENLYLYNNKGRGNMGVAQIGDYVLFAGGRSGTNGQYYVDIYSIQ